MEAAAQIIRGSRHLLVLTGAGISADSGIPTFREARTGLWERYDPQELATPEAFRRDPALVYAWYHWRREHVAAAEPNAGHRAIAELEERLPRVSLVTQNVDGLHRQAGNRHVVEFHGNIREDRCFDCGRSAGEPRPGSDADGPPSCGACGGLLRPAVVWFGETIPEAALSAATQAVEDCDAVLVVGTSSLVYPAAALPDLALRRGAPAIEVNPDETPFTPRATVSLRGTAAEVLPPLVASL